MEKSGLRTIRMKVSDFDAIAVRLEFVREGSSRRSVTATLERLRSHHAPP